jgi:FkbM family methyltransferase
MGKKQRMVFRGILALAAVASVGLLVWSRGDELISTMRPDVTANALCGGAEATGAVELRERQHRDAWELTRATRSIRREGTVALLHTPRGEWWAPVGNKTGAQFGIVEHQRRPYGLPGPGDVVLDAGANIGLFTRAALDAGASLVVAIEPVPANVEALRRNFAKEIRARRVIVYPKGVWHKEDVLEMSLYDESALDSFVMHSRPESKTAARRVALPLTTIDRLVRDLKLSHVDFIKMDIEGAERQALQGAAETVRRFLPRLAIATENLADDPLVIPRLVRDIEPRYTARPGTCIQLEHGLIAPEVYFFSGR